MEITNVRVRRVKSDGKLKGVASVTFDDVFAVHDIKIIEGQDHLFVSMPARKTPDGEFKDIAHPVVSEFRAKLHQIVLDAFNALPEEE